MPPPVVKCIICGEDVLKAQTYAVPGGRACKKHEGVSEASVKLQKDAVEAKEQAERSRREEARKEYEQTHPRRSAFAYPEESVVREQGWVREHCWCCGRKGIRRADAAQVQLVIMERAKQLNINPFGSLLGDTRFEELTRDVFKMLGVDVVFDAIDLDDEKYALFEKWKSRFDHRTHVLANLAKVVCLCQDCQGHMGIKFEMPDFSKVTPEALAMISVAYQNSGAQQKNQELASMLGDIGSQQTGS